MTKTIQRRISRQTGCLFALATVFNLTTIARADVIVEGSPEAVRVTTNQDKIADVLSALAVTFKVKYRTAIPLEAVANRSYTGSLAQVISRVLWDYNYIIKTDLELTDITVYGSRGEVLATPPEAPPAKSIVSRWR